MKRAAAERGRRSGPGGGERSATGERAGGVPGNQAVQRALSAGAAPLDPATRARAEAGLGLGLGEVRVHRGAAADDAARGVGARAFTTGDSIVLGRGAGRESLAHELIHVAQERRFGPARGGAVSARSDPAEGEARSLAPRLLAGAGPLAVRARPSAPLQRDEPQYVMVPMAGTAEPLAAYAGLRERLPIADWNALNAGARRRAERVRTGQASTAEDEHVATEVTVLLDDLFQPPVDECFPAGGDQWLTDVFDSAMAGAGGPALSGQIRAEILNRWLNENGDILFDDVTISLVDPEGMGGGAAGLLVFSLHGNPVASTGGILTLKAVDEAIEGGAQTMIEDVSGQLGGLAAAVEKASVARAMLAAARDIAGKGHDKIAADALAQIDVAMRAGLAELEGIKDSPFNGLVQSYASDLKAYIDGDFANLIVAHQKWRADNPRDTSTFETSSSLADDFNAEAERLRQEGGLWNHIKASHYQSMADAQLDSMGGQIMFSGGEVLRQQQLNQAYDKGLVSYDSWSKGVEASQTRGAIFAGVSIGLMIATAGLGFWIGESLSFGGAVAFGAGTGLIGGVGPMVATNIYTSYEDFQDPGLQEWWKSGMYSPGEIAFSGALGAGIGAALPIAGRLLGGLRGQGAQAVAAIEAGAPLPEGVVARTVGKGVVELTIASEGVTIRLSTKGYQVIGQAGTKTQAVIEEALWPGGLIGEEGLAPGTSVDLDLARYPSSVMFGERGWMMASPKSSMPIQFGYWPELALPGAGGGVQPASSMSPLLLEAAAGGKFVPMPDGETLMVLGGMRTPMGFPTTSLPAGAGLPPFSPFVQMPGSPLVGLDALFPAAKAPLMLGPGPAAAPQMPAFPGHGPFLPRSVIGPFSPETFQSTLSEEWRALAQTRVAGSLPDLGPFGGWRMTTRGWVPVYDILPPGGVPGISLKTYGTGGASDFFVDVPNQIKVGIAMPRPGGTYKGVRRHPQKAGDMFEPATGLTYGESHGFPQAQTKDPGAGQVLSSEDPYNFFAHERKYNEWFRSQMEQKLKRDGLNYTFYDIVGRNPRVTQGGYIIPEAEIFVQFKPDGAVENAWYFPLTDPNFYPTLKTTGSFADVLGQFEMNIDDIPRARR